jgi:hypothetical protein
MLFWYLRYGRRPLTVSSRDPMTARPQPSGDGPTLLLDRVD